MNVWRRSKLGKDDARSWRSSNVGGMSCRGKESSWKGWGDGDKANALRLGQHLAMSDMSAAVYFKYRCGRM